MISDGLMNKLKACRFEELEEDKIMAFEENEISIHSQGGTEIAKRSLAALIPEELKQHFQIISSRVRKIEKDKIRIYWIHDLPQDPEINHLKDLSSRKRFHKIIFNCNHHLNDCVGTLNIPRDSKVDIIEAGSEPIPYKPKSKEGPIKLIYLSTPQRGLEILVPVVEELSKKYNIHLDVFSSFKIYGWDKADDQFGPLFKKIKDHPNMTYHGFAGRETIVESLQNAHILAYPCIWRETACRVLIESMSAGLMCVHPNYGALSDTSGMLTLQYQYQDNLNDHANIFAFYLKHALDNVLTDEAQSYLSGFVKTYTDRRFNLQGIANRWQELMEALLAKFPTEESRKIEEEMFIYRT